MAVKKKAKTNAKKTTPNAGREARQFMEDSLGPVEIMFLWQDTPIPPDIVSSGSNWVVIGGPPSDEEFTRDSCTLTHTPPGGTPVVIETGDIGYPFDGSCFLRSNLASGKHIFTAEASYSQGANPAPRSVEITLP